MKTINYFRKFPVLIVVVLNIFCFSDLIIAQNFEGKQELQ